MMKLSEAASAMQGSLNGQDDLFASVEFDARRIKRDGLFFAIHGESKNGHDFINDAAEKGAVAAVVDEGFVKAAEQKQIQVDDTTIALGMLAGYWRKRFDIPIIGITGSNGKTTVTNIVSSIFQQALPGVAPQGSFNNQWGVPLTLLKLREGDESAIIEMGMNHAGELSYLGRIVRPTIALINNAAAAHLEGLKNIRGVAKAKGEIIDSASEDGTVVLNRDDDFYADWLARAAKRNCISFGLHEKADVRLLADNDEGKGKDKDDRGVRLSIAGKAQKFSFALLGHHNQMNAAAAAAVALASGISINAIAKGLQKALPVSGRLKPYYLAQDITLIDDSYNANEASMRAAIDVLAAKNGQKILVLGAMGELGKASQSIHASVAAYAKKQGVNALFVLAEVINKETKLHKDIKAYAIGFGASAIIFEAVDAIAAAIKSEVMKTGAKKTSTILIKGSRCSQMERVVKVLIKTLSAKEKVVC